MADTVTIAGKRLPKWAVFGGVGVAVVGGVLFLRRKSSGAGGAAGGTGTDPVTGLPYSMDNQVDPATGLTYLAEAQQYGSVSAAEAAVGAGYGGVSGTTTGYSGLGYGGSAGGSSVPYITGSATGTSATYATNADWAQAVIAALPAITGDSQNDVATAVAHYLAGLPLTSVQVNDIQVALAEFGPPPSPPAAGIVAQGSGSGPTGTGSGSGSGSGSPPPATGGPITVAPTGFRVVSVTDHDNVNLAWNPVKVPAGEGPLTGYVVAYGPTSGSQKYKQYVPAGASSTTVAGVGGGSAGKHYFELWATPAKAGGPHAGPIEATTTKS